MILPSADGLSLREWTDEVMIAGRQYGLFDLVGDDWRGWGMGFFLSPQLGALNPADPYQFTGWREWAEALTNSVLTARAAPGPGAS